MSYGETYLLTYAPGEWKILILQGHIYILGG